MVNDHDSRSGFLALASEDPPSPGAMLQVDPLSDVLRAVRMTAATYFLIDATQPYCVEIPHTDHYRAILQPGARHMMSYHVILEGAGVATLPGLAPQSYRAGDILVFPQGDGYRMGTAADTPAELDYDQTMEFFHGLADGTLPFVIPEGGGHPPPTRVICGFLGCDAAPFNPLIASLPRLLIIRRAKENDLLDQLIDLTMAEARRADAGGASVRLGLAELMFVEAIRRHAAASKGSAGWLTGLGDAVVGRALSTLHSDPVRDWTLKSLAGAVGASRSVLAERFASQVGQGPIQYLTQWRIQLAARRLVEGNDKVGAIAFDVGYRSEAAFSRAFKRVAGVSPAEWRRDGRTQAPDRA